jgi:hypothetical protein
VGDQRCRATLVVSYSGEAGSNIVPVAGTLGIGCVSQAALAGSATVRVKLTPSVASPPTLMAEETHGTPPHRKSA